MFHLTVRELRKEAKRQGLKGYSELRKDDLIWLLNCHYNKTCSQSLIYDTGYAPSQVSTGTNHTSSNKFHHKVKRGSDDTWNVYTKAGCPYCANAKALLDSKRIAYKEHRITDENKDKILESLKVVTGGYRYVPIIIKNGEFIGGFTELSGMLKHRK